MKSISVLAEQITKSSSYQSYITIKLLADKSQVDNFFKGYAYFRWVDDMVDENLKTKSQRINFINRQKKIIENSYRGKKNSHLSKEEKMVAQLIKTDRDKESKLGSFILNFLAIIEFDAYRKGELINKNQLNWYIETLAKAVIDGILYFVVNDKNLKDSKNQYLSAMGAFVTHMLRDMGKDIPEGYINIPKECLSKDSLKSKDVRIIASKKWVKSQVELAKNCFREGNKSFDRVPSLRYKIAAYWYSARFEPLLDLIEKENYALRPMYKKDKGVVGKLRFFGVALIVLIKHFYSLSIGKLAIGRD